MPAQTYGLSTTDIRWDYTQTEVDQSGVDFITINCVGYLREEGQSLGGALLVIPSTIEISSTGPVKSSLELDGANLDTRSTALTGDGRIECRATYKIPLSSVINGPDDSGTSGQTSDSDRYDLRVEVEEAPILSHPVAIQFPIKDKNKLKNLLESDIIPNPDYVEGDADASEFQYAIDIGDNKQGDEVEFDNTDVSVGGVTASPLDYARIIKAGIETYLRPAARWVWNSARTERPDNAELNTVGDVVNPPGAPNIADGRDWLFNGVSDTQEAPEAHVTAREYVLSDRGGALQEIYKDGSGSING